MHNVYLFQPQYAVEFREEKNYWLPYSAGCLWSYASQFTDIRENFILRELFFKRQPIDEILDRIDNPKVCGFSCYLWNEQYSLAVAKAIKLQWPDCIIVFGGAQVSGRMLKYEFIDSLVLAEGEEAFTKILQDIIAKNPIDKLTSRSRLQDLNIPSPYVTGVFDQLIIDNPNTIWAMTLETNRGCPYACTFCDWGGTTYSKVKKFNLNKVAAELDWAANHRVAYIFSADANFGIFKERDVEIAKLIRAAADNSIIETVNLQFAKNSTEIVFEIAKIMGPYNRGITVSVQSMNDLTLETIKRKNLEINNIKYLLELSKKYDLSTYTEVILGLPHETKESWINGLTQLLELGQHQSIDIWFTQLLENSELATEQSRREYGIKSILVKDYMNLEQTEDSISEYTEIVCETNTMSTEEMIDCYMYTWMIIHFHIAGYTQIIAKYARNLENISFRIFYDQLFTEIQYDKSCNEHYQSLRNTVANYLITGTLTGKLAGGHALHAVSYKFMYENRRTIANLAVTALRKLIPIIPTDLLLLQDLFIIDITKQYPQTLQTNYNIDDGSKMITTYVVTQRIKEQIEDFYTIRRKGLIKNLLLIS